MSTLSFDFVEVAEYYGAFWVLFQTPAKIVTGSMKVTQPGGGGLTCVKKCTPSTGRWNPIPKVLMITRILSKFSLWNNQNSKVMNSSYICRYLYYMNKHSGILLECDNCQIGLNSHFIDLMHINFLCVDRVLCASGHVLICSKCEFGYWTAILWLDTKVSRKF